jgi:hypothetical protein
MEQRNIKVLSDGRKVNINGPLGIRIYIEDCKRKQFAAQGMAGHAEYMDEKYRSAAR